MGVAESILELARRVVRLDQQIAQLNREKAKTLADYNKLVGNLINGRPNGQPTQRLPCLRCR